MLLANKRIYENSRNNEEMADQNSINIQNNSMGIESSSQQNNLNNYQNLMLDSLLLRSSSESFSIDRNQLKNLSNPHEHQRERVFSFNSVNNSHGPSKNPKSFISQIRNIVENKALTDTFHHNKFNSVSSRLKEINQTPERILDAPQLIDDYYLNLLDWSSQNILSVCLGNSVYLWNGNTYETLQLMSDNDNICSVNWMDTGNVLAIGMKGGNIELWDTIKLQQIRNMAGHEERVCSLAWNNYLLSSGSKDTKILNHDVRIRNHLVHKLSGHAQEVCALRWSNDGSVLASGGNDNLVCIWDINQAGAGTNSTNLNNFAVPIPNTRSRSNLNNNLTNNFTQPPYLANTNLSIRNNNLLTNGQNNNTSSIWSIIQEGNDMVDDPSSLIQNNMNSNYNSQNSNSTLNVTEINPKFCFNQHEAAVKALAWCPWQKGVLATGGGAKDKTIKFWNTDTGSLINSVETGSQVCALLWDKHEREIISSHGYSKHQISIWKYPSMYKISELNGHMSRVLYLSMSPDGCSIVSGAGDETLRFWKIHDSKKYSSSDSLDFKSSSSKIMSSYQIR